MEWSELFKHFALYGLLSNLVFGFWLYKRTRHTNSARISLSAVTSKTNYYISAIGATTAAILLALNVYGYMYQQTAMPPTLYVLFGIAFIMLIVLAWVPASKGLAYMVHRWAAWIMSYLMLTLTGLLYVDSYENIGKSLNLVNGWEHLVGVFFAVALATVGTYTNLPNLSAKKSLHSQQLYFVVFQLAVVVRIYLG